MNKKPTISMIAAIGKHTRALGKDNELLWKISDDLKRFRAITNGHPVIMGRKTHESIGRPLLDRLNIVISRNSDYEAKGCTVVTSLDSALDLAKQKDNIEIFFIGGAQIYEAALPLADKLYLTLVDSDIEGDVYFPDYSEFKNVIFQENHIYDGLRYSFVNLIR